MYFTSKIIIAKRNEIEKLGDNVMRKERTENNEQ